MAKQKNDTLGTPTVIVRDEATKGALSYYADAGVIRVQGEGVDITIPEGTFAAFMTALRNDAEAVATGLVKDPKTTRIDVPVTEVPLDPAGL